MRSRMPQAIWALGLVSLFMDVSSEMIHGLLPIFVVGTLGASAFALGLMEGVAEAVASVLKLPSGWLSDRWRRRKPLALAGYGLAAVVKPIFALAPGLGWVFAARCLDRIGKGIRGAPRDALVADLAPRALHGAAFGLRQALDTVGAFTGPLIAVAIMVLSGEDVRLVFWLAVPPAFIAVLLLWILVPDAPAAVSREPIPQSPGAGLSLSGMGRPFWGAIALAALFTLGRYSEAFLVLRAQERGLPLALAPLVLVAMNVVYSLAAYPAGRWSDRLGRRGLLLTAALVMAAADLLLAAAEDLALVAAGVTMWGLHMALSQGVLTALVADTAPPHRRGTAFGVFHLASGIALLAASAGSGLLWTRYGPQAAFLAGLAVALASALGGLARHGCVLLGSALFGTAFPWGTLAVNVVGSAAVGLFAGWVSGGGIPPQGARHFFVIGFCGGFTTFSAFSLQALELALLGAWIRAALYVLGSLVLCLAAVALGWILAGGVRP